MLWFALGFEIAAVLGGGSVLEKLPTPIGRCSRCQRNCSLLLSLLPPALVAFQYQREGGTAC